MRKRNFILPAILFSMVICGCQPQHVSIDISGMDNVNAVELNPHGTLKSSAIVLRDQTIVNKWKSYLVKINHNWQRDSWNTFPTPKETVVLKENNTYKFAIYIGTDYAWVGVRKEDQAPALHSLSVEESNELKDLVKEFKTGH